MTDGLPRGLAPYKRTPVFDQDTLPRGLRRDHSTKEGVWALIHVLEGRVCYRTQNPQCETVISPGVPGVIRPGQLHAVEPLGPMRMFVEFHASQAIE